MRVLITGANSMFGVALAGALARHHEVATIDLERSSRSDGPIGDVRDRELAAQVAGECDVVIHLPLAATAFLSPLDALDLATRGTYNLLTTASKATRFILISTLRHFERYPMHWRVTERWAPRPTATVEDLAPYLAELTVREAARVLPLKGIALRLGEVVDQAGSSRDVRWLHIDDAVQAVELALAFEPEAHLPRNGWWIFHIPGGGRSTRFPLGQAGQPSFGYRPQHDLSTSAAPVAVVEPPTRHSILTDQVGLSSNASSAGRIARNVVIYGAGGPLATVTSEALAIDHVLRLTDVRPLADIVAENRPQSPGAPLPRLLDMPHEAQVVDITDLDQVVKAAQGMNVIANCTAMRNHPVEAFRVNTLGAYNVMRAALACGIRRVVHTGPVQLFLDGPAGYQYDFGLAADLPARPGTELYFISKFLGQEICRIFAEEHDLEVPCLLFGTFLDPWGTAYEPHGAYPMTISWADAAQAMRLAIDAPCYPRPFEVLHIGADLPHGKFSNEAAKRLLHWQPYDRLEKHWQRRLE